MKQFQSIFFKNSVIRNNLNKTVSFRCCKTECIVILRISELNFISSQTTFQSFIWSTKTYLSWNLKLLAMGNQPCLKMKTTTCYTMSYYCRDWRRKGAGFLVGCGAD